MPSFFSTNDGSFSLKVVFGVLCPFFDVQVSETRYHVFDLAADLRRHAVKYDVMPVFIFSAIEENVAVVSSTIAEQVSRLYVLIRDNLADLECHVMRIVLDLLVEVFVEQPDGKACTVTALLCLSAKLIRPS